MDTLEIVRKEAEQKFSSPEEVNAFMNGFEKQASLHLTGDLGLVSRLLRNPDFSRAATNAGVGLMAGLGGALVFKGLTAGSNAVSNFSLQSKFESALTQVMNTNKIIKSADPTKVKSYANTLFSFAPHVASDPNILSSLLANAVLGEGVDPMTIRSVADLEGRYRDNNAAKPLIGIKA